MLGRPLSSQYFGLKYLHVVFVGVWVADVKCQIVMLNVSMRVGSVVERNES